MLANMTIVSIQSISLCSNADHEPLLENPQLSTSGKKASEAAGIGSTGRKTAFDSFEHRPSLDQVSSGGQKQVSPLSSTKKASAEDSVSSTETPHAMDTDIKDAPLPSIDSSGRSETPSAESLTATEPPRPPEEVVQDRSPPPSNGEKELAQGIANAEGIDVDAGKEISALAEKEKEEHSREAAQQKESADAGGVLGVSSEPSVQASGITISNSVPDTVGASVSTQSTPTDVDKTAVVSDTAENKASRGLETEKERNIANLKAEEENARVEATSQGGQGGPKGGAFQWMPDVEPAVRGLIRNGTPNSPAGWNLVVLHNDLSKEEVHLAFPARSAEPAELASILAEATKNGSGEEPCYAFYAHPGIQSDSDAVTRVLLLYVCPMHCTVRQRMLYSTNLLSLVKHSSSFERFDVVKRVSA